ncbi:lysine-specific histone demethylase 1B [Trichonephila clavata]|uniref:Lysine-specific histone demethylase 1B n=1 Tax=Trichonephila clavata TaxID=2740835 RepID=A0A8X6GQA6_TRICU|nr:lysine-specific histone demethylase 1B [Trichonephila clavata]
MSENGSSRRVSNRTKRKNVSEENKDDGKKARSCEKYGCYASEPTCCLNACESCSVSGYTSRWYHMSLGEHFCNNCFDNFYRVGKTGNTQFNKWSDKWALIARASKPTLKRFVANELLPYWVKCTQRPCGKWRMVCMSDILDPKYISTFKCSKDPKVKSCETPENADVSLVLDPTFMSQLAEEPLFKKSPAGHYLKRFLPEDIGICPINVSLSSFKELKNIEPFLIQQCGQSSIWIKPDEMDEDEMAFANQVLVTPATYLGMRNFLVAAWNLNPSEWLSFAKINEYLICRGLVRIYLISVAEQILELLTKKSVINFGIIQNPSLKLMKKCEEAQVLVIGAGISGLAAASHLHNLGINVAIYEAESDLGGRVKDVPTLGSGAFFIHGLLNNPFTTLALQASASFQILNKDLVVFKRSGEVVSDKVVQKTQHELNGLLQGVVESVAVSKKDDNFYDMVTNSCDQMKKRTPFCKDHDVFKHLLAHCELDLKANLNDMSVLSWESNLCVLGDDAFMPNGLRLLLLKLARDVNINYNNRVQAIDYSGEKVKVKTSNGESSYSKVLITVPLTALQSDFIQFNPPLPDFKQSAINNLGNYYCEKLILEFPKKFWIKNPKESFSKFGIVSPEAIFEIFIDITNEKADSKPTLITFISQKSFDFMKALEDKEIVDKCMALLRSVFRRNIPQPSKWYLTHWKEKSPSCSYGSYLKVGRDQSTYDDMAKSIDDKLFFAGEATFRNMPSSITGAYLSGLREAAKICKDLEL